MEVWPFVPQREFTESLEWLTDVMRGRDAEQRLSLRMVPREGLSFDHLLDDGQLARAKSFSRALGASEFLVPCWQYRNYVGAIGPAADSLPVNTDSASYEVGDTIVVWESESKIESRTIESVSPGSVGFVSEPLDYGYSAAIVMPARVSKFAQNLNASRRTGPLHRVQARFESTQTRDLSAAAPTYATYRGYDVLTDHTVLVSDISERYVQEASRFDGSLGLTWIGPSKGYAVNSTAAAWSLDDEAATWATRGWLHVRRGRWKAFWMPSWSQDFTLAAPASNVATVISVHDVGFRLTGTGDLSIDLVDGSSIRRRILSTAVGGAGIENLTLDSAIGVAVDPADVVRIQLINFMRFDADRVEIRHVVGRGATIMVPLLEVPYSAP